MTTIVANLPFGAMYAVMLAYAVVRGSFFYAVGACTRVPNPRVQAFASRLVRGPVATAVARVDASGARAVTATYWVPGLAAATQIVAGMAGMDRRRYAAGFLLAACPWAVLEASVGSAVVGVLTSPYAVSLAVAAVAALVWRRRRSFVGRIVRQPGSFVTIPA